MATRNRITEKFPKTGALPSEQAALKDLHPGNGGKNWVWQQDKLICQLVQNCVDYAAEQFHDNLQFNTEVLTNVLYDNIYKILGEKFEEEKFVEWIVDELVESGFVMKSEESEQTKQKEKPPPEPVVELDDSEYQKLKDNVTATIKLLQTKKVEVFKILSDVDWESKVQSQ